MKKRQLIKLFAALMFLIDITIIVVISFQNEYSFLLNPGNIDNEVGFAYEASIGSPGFPFEIPGDSNESPTRSGLILYENGKIIGKPHSLHKSIRDIGGGLYSHWHKYLIFSTSDNSDPRSNGRKYEIISPLKINSKVQLALLFLNLLPLVSLCILIQKNKLNIIDIISYFPFINKKKVYLITSGMRSISNVLYSIWNKRQKYLSYFYILTIGCFALYINHILLHYTEMYPCINPDSASYLQYNITRTIGYPLFIKLIYTLSDNIFWIIPVQLNLMLLSFASLGYAVGRVADNKFIWFLLTMLMFGILPLILTSYMLLTEALFTVFICMHFAFACLFIKYRKFSFAIFSGITLICIILVRPAGYPFLLGIPLLVLLLRGEIKKITLGIGGPVIIGFILAVIINWQLFHILGTQSVGGISLLGHVSYLLDDNDAKGEYADVIKNIVENSKEITTPLKKMNFPREIWWETMWKYNELLYHHALPEIKKYVDKTYIDLDSEGRKSLVNDIAMAISLHAIKSHPKKYIFHVLSHYYGMWQGFFLDYGDVPFHVNMCYEGSKKVVNKSDESKIYYKSKLNTEYLNDKNVETRILKRKDEKTISWMWWHENAMHQKLLISILFLACFLLTLKAIIKIEDSLLCFIVYCSVILNGYLLFIASVQAALERYSVPFTPILYVILIGSALSIFRIIWRNDFIRSFVKLFHKI